MGGQIGQGPQTASPQGQSPIMAAMQNSPILKALQNVIQPQGQQGPPQPQTPQVQPTEQTGLMQAQPAASPQTTDTSADDQRIAAILGDPAQRAKLPAGMRNNNPGNIKYVGQKDSQGPSVNTDEGDPQATYATPEQGMHAMYNLLSKKYAGGKTTPMSMIAGEGGWTPGNTEAAANVAKYAGIGVNDDIGMADPAKAAKFMRGLMQQEHGNSSKLYSDAMIQKSITGQPSVDGTASPQLAGIDPSGLDAHQRVLMTIMGQKADAASQAPEGTAPSSDPDDRVMAAIAGTQGPSAKAIFAQKQAAAQPDMNFPQVQPGQPALDTGADDIAQAAQVGQQRLAAGAVNPKAQQRKQALEARVRNQKAQV